MNLNDNSMAHLCDNHALYLEDDTRAYSIPEQLQAKHPFWLFNANEEEENLTLAGTSTKTAGLTTSLHPGWNLFSSAKNYSLADTDFVAWEWDGEKYEIAETLKPACGYWLYRD